MASTVAGVGLARTATLLAPPTRSATEVAAPTRSLRDSETSTDPDRVAEVGARRHRSGVQRGQQHVREATRAEEPGTRY